LFRSKPWWDPWNSTGKPLLLVDPNWFLIDQLSSSIHHPLGCCISAHGCSLSKASVLIEMRSKETVHERALEGRLLCCAMHYVDPIVHAELWGRLHNSTTPEARISWPKGLAFGRKTRCCFMSIHMLSCCPKEEEVEGIWGKSDRTWRKWVRHAIARLHHHHLW